MQSQRYFFGDRDRWRRKAPTHEEKLWMVDRGNPDCPLSKFVGNDKAVRKLQAVAYDALGRDNHLCREISFSIFGPASSGKTTLVRLFAETIGLPFVEFGPQVRGCDEMLKEIERVLSVENVPLVEFKRRGYFEMPPTVVFIDEIHAVTGSVIQSLLKATEYSDGVMVTESGRTVNCHDVTWMIATTDEGMLFDAFRSRFSPLNLTYLSRREIGGIVRLAHPDMPNEACERIAFYNSRVPRKALEFARYAKIVKSMSPDETWDEVIRRVASDEGIDELGMQSVHRRVIEALASSPVSRSRMPTVVGRKKEEVERYVMPWLMSDTEDGKALVRVSNRGFELTDEGVAACRNRGIAVVSG